jgi:hypothetical protein
MSEGLSPPRKRARLRAEEATTRQPEAFSSASSLTPDSQALTQDPQDPQDPPSASRLSMSSFLLLPRGRLDAHAASASLPADPASAEAVSAAAGALEALSNGVVPPPSALDEPMPMAVAVAAEESTTDDEELQQLAMVKLEPDASGGIELEFDDVMHFLFNMARELRPRELHKGLRTVKKARNAELLLPRLLAAEDESGLTLLMYGVRSNDRVFCAMLLDAGADVNLKTVRDRAALLHGALLGWVAAASANMLYCSFVFG